MSKTTTTRFDIAEHLRTPEEMATYLEAAVEEVDGNAAFFTNALDDIVRAQGVGKLDADFMSLARLWEARDVTLESIRKKHGRGKNNNLEQYHGMG
ncbi:MAG: hypothetical protein D3917_09740 [Candidatus Electrothrix sp. AX5]|nr:hypothetical protein [Candidatus Electrothrix sp. AX5]